MADAHETPQVVHPGGLVEVLVQGLVGHREGFAFLRLHQDRLLRKTSMVHGASLGSRPSEGISRPAAA